MKTKILILLLVSIAFTFSSFKTDPTSKKLNAINFFKAKRNITELKKGTPRTAVLIGPDGQFFTTFGYGFGYGYTFTYPTSVGPGENGTSWNPDCSWNGNYCGTAAQDYEQDGDSFSVSYTINPDYPNGVGRIEIFSGHYVIDSTSPTNVSIIYDNDVIIYPYN